MAGGGKGIEIVTPVGVAIYPVLVEKEAYQGGEPKFKLSIVFPESVLADPRYPKQREKMAALQEAFASLKKSHPGKLAGHCFKRVGIASDDDDGSEDKLLEHFPKDTLYLRTSSKYAVATEDQSRRPLDPGDIYAGCHVRVSGKLLLVPTYSRLIFGLGAVQLAAKKEALDLGGGRGAKAFDDDPLATAPDESGRGVADSNSLFDD